MQQLSLWNSETSGLIVHRASRTERLAEWLAGELERSRPTNPLQPQSVVIAHSGLRRWLLGEFARRGPRGIAANIEMILPWQWLERTTDAVLGEAGSGGGDYRREWLRWHVFAALPEIDEPQLVAYLQGEDGERRRFQLAERIAGVFEQYLIYRPDWIGEWERAARPRDWQARLWKRVRGAIGMPHRAQRRDMLLAALAKRGDGEMAPLHVFGVSHLAPDVLAALRALATRRSVHLYFPDPCREHWVYFRTHRAQLASASERAQYYEVGHPLLASLGRMGQDFCFALEEIDAHEQRDGEDDAEPPSHFDTLLAQLQSSIRCAAPELIGAEIRVGMASLPDRKSDEYGIAAHELRERLFAQRTDASLRIHACHTRLRELEALRDALLGFLAEDKTLAHGDIVVMAPDISAYAASLPAVFGEAAHYEADPARIPWHLADVTLARAHPLIGAFLRLLNLRESRFMVSEVMDFLDVPALALRFGIDDPARVQIEHALRRARVAWGLDATMKAQAGGAAIAANSWDFGFDRLYAGYMSGNDGGEALDGVLPAKGVDGSVAEALGRMDEMLEALRDTRDGLARPRTLADWSTWLRHRIEATFRADGRDEAESAALAALQRTVVALNDQAIAAGPDTLLPWEVVRDVLRAAVDAVPERQPFLYGGVTFCGLVPHRSIPFRVICVLGMNEGEFPRVLGDAEINRILEKPRRGDRDVRSEDRYLFLEALMSARERLHISYLGTDAASGKARNPAAPLAELTQVLDEQCGLASAKNDDWPRPWLVLHPPQPFDACYYVHDNERQGKDSRRHDPRLFSFRSTFAVVPQADRAAGAPVFLAPAAKASAQIQTDATTLAALKRFWRDPARAILRESMGVGLDALADESWPDREPLDTKTDRRERIERCLVLDALQSGDDVPLSPPPWLALSGALAAGNTGRMAYAQARTCARAALDTLPSDLRGGAQRAAQSLELDLGDDVRLVGKIDDVYRAADGRLWRFDVRLTRAADFGDLIPLYIDWAALKLGRCGDASLCFLENARKSQSGAPNIAAPRLLEAINSQTGPQLLRGLRRLIAARVQVLAEPVVFPMKTAWAWACASAAERESGARKAWLGDNGSTGESQFSESYVALLARGADFLATGTENRARFAAVVDLLADVLDPQRSILPPGSESDV